MNIAIDGPSGAGKSTLGKMLAKKLNLLYLDTGAMYRAVAYGVLQNGISPDDEAEVVKIAKNSRVELLGEPDNLSVKLNGEDITAKIRTNEIGQTASIISAHSQVRRNLVKRQQEIGKLAPNGCVLDGRDIGTVVFPDADIKFFLTATPETRARRRFSEDSERGRKTTFEATLAEINERDERDVSRTDSPLMIAEDAVVIDTGEMDLPEVIEKMLNEISTK